MHLLPYWSHTVGYNLITHTHLHTHTHETYVHVAPTHRHTWIPTPRQHPYIHQSVPILPVSKWICWNLAQWIKGRGFDQEEAKRACCHYQKRLLYRISCTNAQHTAHALHTGRACDVHSLHDVLPQKEALEVAGIRSCSLVLLEFWSPTSSNK